MIEMFDEIDVDTLNKFNDNTLNGVSGGQVVNRLDWK